MRSLLLLLLMPVMFLVACQPKETPMPPSPDAVDAVLDDWHAAAAEGDFERYFAHFESDSSIFMGTDATERWTVAEFKPWSKPYFEDDGVAWTFTPTFRKIYFSDNGMVAWFDEELDTPNLGPSRGTGVLVKNENGWKIAHYNLTIPIPNSIVDDVVEQIESELNKSAE
ncbi:nuclear transport factor 2 family protein [Gracilimonas amylolytica]|uniref:nuclear transport factor 2 family protein n=1 Tax=Gracilimonas amylolytica TaxID=1749045 RepID=UPI000CD9B2EE|nr:nuclear transport factor 2 family protein [Gracilimonas amylolytica]